ncbi:hypothetical protein Tco_0692794, partial [Tanacetum coccineum]
MHLDSHIDITSDHKPGSAGRTSIIPDSVHAGARVLEDEPLNQTRRSNKLRRPKHNWSTLGEPSRKWDYYVKYDAPVTTTSVEEIAATDWGDESPDDENTPGKVPILDESSNWDDDERSGGKILVLREELSQNQQDFLDKYLPQRD